MNSIIYNKVSTLTTGTFRFGCERLPACNLLFNGVSFARAVLANYEGNAALHIVDLPFGHPPAALFVFLLDVAILVVDLLTLGVHTFDVQLVERDVQIKRQEVIAFGAGCLGSRHDNVLLTG